MPSPLDMARDLQARHERIHALITDRFRAYNRIRRRGPIEPRKTAYHLWINALAAHLKDDHPRWPGRPFGIQASELTAIHDRLHLED